MGRKKLDYVLVIDIESTCWEGTPLEGQSSEIIEVGLCMLDIALGERRERESIIVRPERSTVSEYCTRLTSLTHAQVEQGLSFSEICAILRKRFRSKERIWASYGDYDRHQFEEQCQEHGVAYPFSTAHINVKSLCAVACGMPREVGMTRALKLLGLPLEGSHHRGGDDAWNVAGILSMLISGMRSTLVSKKN